MSGLHAVGHIFVPAAGIMASIPYLTWFISKFIGPIFEAIERIQRLRRRPYWLQIWGYQLANALKTTYEG